MDPHHVHAEIGHVVAGSGIMKFTLVLTGLVGAVLIFGGIWLVFLGTTANTEMSLFGSQFKSQNVGVVGIFCGAVVVVLNVRRTMSALEKLASIGEHQISHVPEAKERR